MSLIGSLDPKTNGRPMEHSDCIVVAVDAEWNEADMGLQRTTKVAEQPCCLL
jgi:hypothetical protein